MPVLGHRRNDYISVSDMLSQVAERDTTLSRLAHASNKKLCESRCEDAPTAEEVAEVNAELNIFNWIPAMRFSHLLLSCVTVDVSSSADTGNTRLCFPYICGNHTLLPEKAMVSLCGLTWFLAFLLDENLATGARVRIKPHKALSAGEDSQWWFREVNDDQPAAGAITKDGNDVVYMCEGGYEVQHRQSHVLGAFVVVCKSWAWAALVHAAARMVALSSNNALGPLLPDFVTWKGDDDTKSSVTSPIPDFISKCDNTYKAVNKAVSSALYDIDKEDYEARVDQSQRINELFTALKKGYRQEANRILHTVTE